MSENPKEEIIEKACKEFFGSIADTLKQAKNLDKSIKLEDVKNGSIRNSPGKRSNCKTHMLPTTRTKHIR